MNDPNRQILERAAEVLSPLIDELVFVGGCATGLLVTDPTAAGIRPTRDVDTITQVSSYAEYAELSARLREIGLRDDTEGGVICRWFHEELTIDVMPDNELILGFTNRWYQPAIATARQVRLRTGTIRLVTPPYFLATKLEAFHGRGEADLANSPDLEDIITVIDGRQEIIDEVQRAEPGLQRYLAGEFRALIGHPSFLDALPGFLLPDSASQARAELILARLESLGTIPG